MPIAETAAAEAVVLTVAEAAPLTSTAQPEGRVSPSLLFSPSLPHPPAATRTRKYTTVGAATMEMLNSRFNKPQRPTPLPSPAA